MLIPLVLAGYARYLKGVDDEGNAFAPSPDPLLAELQPIVAGLDPVLKFVPEHIQQKAFQEHGETLEGAAEAIWQYNK